MYFIIKYLIIIIMIINNDIERKCIKTGKNKNIFVTDISFCYRFLVYVKIRVNPIV